MANRFKGQRLAGLKQRLGRAGAFVRWCFTGVRPLVRATVVLGLLAAIGLTGWRAVQVSPYFVVRHVDAEATPHLDRARIIELMGLLEPTNVFQFDAGAARDALLSHPWVATATVERVLPDRVIARVEERDPAGAVVLDQPYLVDATGRPFVQAPANAVAGLTLITGLDRAAFEADPEGARERVRDALAVARRYALSPLAERRPLGNVHLAPGDRLELMLGHTRVALGRGDFRDKIQRLEQILDAMAARKVDASYILLSEDLERAIVKEVPLRRGLGGALSDSDQGVVN